MGKIYEAIRASDNKYLSQNRDNSMINFLDFFEILVIYSNDIRTIVANYLLNSSSFCSLDHYVYDSLGNEIRFTNEDFQQNYDVDSVLEYAISDFLESIINENESYKYIEHYLRKSDILTVPEIRKIGLVNEDQLSDDFDTQEQHNNELSENLIVQLADSQAVIDRLQAENEQLRQKQTRQPVNSSSVLDTILDETHKYHAPDLKHAIDLWNDLYINGSIGGDSHSSKANRWISNNTGYGNSPDNTSVKRLRETTTPLKDFGQARKKG